MGSDKQIKNFSAGDEVNFAILLNKGKAQAFDLTPADGGGYSGNSSGCGKGKACGGKANSYPEWNGKGCGGYAKGGGYPGFADLGPPNLYQQRPLPPKQPSEWWEPPEPTMVSAVEVPGVTDRRFVGTVKSFKEMKFGFLTCKELQAKFQDQDIYVHWNNLGSFRPGDAVSFRAIVNEQGGAKAVDLQPHDG